MVAGVEMGQLMNDLIKESNGCLTAQNLRYHSAVADLGPVFNGSIVEQAYEDKTNGQK